MRIKYTMILMIVVLAFGFTSISGIGKTEELEKVLEDGFRDEQTAGLKCTLESKKSAVRSDRNRGVTVSINSSWICR